MSELQPLVRLPYLEEILATCPGTNLSAMLTQLNVVQSLFDSEPRELSGEIAEVNRASRNLEVPPFLCMYCEVGKYPDESVFRVTPPSGQRVTFFWSADPVKNQR